MKRLTASLVVTLASLAFAGQVHAQNDNNLKRQTEQTGQELKQESQQTGREAKQETKEAGREAKQEAKQAKQKAQQETQQAKQQVSQAMSDDPQKVVVEFDKGQAQLSKDARNKLREAAKQAKQAGEIDKAYVAAWSDQPFPGQERPEDDQAKELGDQRVENIEQVLEQAGVDEIDTFNLAEKTSLLAQWFSTDEAELKSQFARSAEEEQMTEKDFQVIKEEGGPSKSVVIFRVKSQQQQGQQGK